MQTLIRLEHFFLLKKDIEFLISSILLSGDVISKSVQISNLISKYFSDSIKACLIANNFELPSLENFFGLINQDFAPNLFATFLIFLNQLKQLHC